MFFNSYYNQVWIYNYLHRFSCRRPGGCYDYKIRWHHECGKHWRTLQSRQCGTGNLRPYGLL